MFFAWPSGETVLETFKSLNGRTKVYPRTGIHHLWPQAYLAFDFIRVRQTKSFPFLSMLL